MLTSIYSLHLVWFADTIRYRLIDVSDHFTYFLAVLLVCAVDRSDEHIPTRAVHGKQIIVISALLYQRKTTKANRSADYDTAS